MSYFCTEVSSDHDIYIYIYIYECSSAKTYVMYEILDQNPDFSENTGPIVPKFLWGVFGTLAHIFPKFLGFSPTDG